MRVLKQSTARNIMVLMVQSSDHVTGLAGLTLTITASKDGAAFASISPTVTDRSDGWYELALDTTMTNTLGDLALHITGTSADPTDVLMQIVAYDPTDAVRAGLTALPNATAGANNGLPVQGGAIPNANAEASGGLLTRGTGAGQINPDGAGNVPVNGGSVGSVTGSVGSVTGSVTVGSYASGKNPGGQIKPNSFNDKYVYDVSKRITSCRIRVFSSKAAADSATSGAADNAEGEIERYIVTATYNTDGTIKTYEFAKDL